MWLATRQGWFSITVPPDEDGRRLQIRARDPEHLEALLAEHGVHTTVRHTPNRDYPYRAYVLREVVAEMLLAEVFSIDYSNFKDEAARVHGSRSRFLSFLHRVWGAGLSIEPMVVDGSPIPKASKQRRKSS